MQDVYWFVGDGWVRRARASCDASMLSELADEAASAKKVLTSAQVLASG